ncbi:hypothetical protein AK812_SmicGene15865 [Symbiodinium microadriaticum]|uniref:Uncharacterized protein n=1 Tax=Symbiodinium microadriaticum TaxID=2951 RepID=A0A1Q9E1U7_SYMMI|nr:hypothetical protein AK812_SmicGene15865 [Symbiodinium microadriaticum]
MEGSRAYWVYLQKLQVDNFGRHGCFFVLERLGIHKAAQSFAKRADQEVRRYIRGSNEALKDLTHQDVMHKRVCSFAAYELHLPGGARREGAMIRENGFWSASTLRGGKCRWLRAAQNLKVGALVDRTLCSEFQTLEELCDIFEEAGGTDLATIRTQIQPWLCIMESVSTSLARVPLLKADPRKEGIGQAAWQLEDCLRDRLVTSYPSSLEKVAHADFLYTRALTWMLILTVFETPSWCDNENSFFNWISAEERCAIEGVPSSDILLSNVPYIPPGVGLIAETVILFVIARKLLLERALQVRYFKPIGVEYHSMWVIRFGLVMCIWKSLDMLAFAIFRMTFRTSFIARTGFLVMLPSVRRLGHCE